MISAVDTSVVVAALLDWHEHHARGFAALARVLESDDELVVPQPVVIESYAVLTRMPSPHRIRATDARELLSLNLRRHARTVGLPARDTWSLLDRLADAGIVGGASYDAVIVQCAVDAGANQILTFNARDFTRLAPASLEVVVP